MTRHRLQQLALLALASLALSSLTSSTAAASLPETVDVGEEKARIYIDDGWQAIVLDPSLGSHQWIRGSGIEQTVLVVQEFRGLLLEERDFVSVATRNANLIKVGMTGNAQVSKATFRRRLKLGVAEVSVEGEADGQELHFEFRVVGRDGLGYSVMTWTSKGNAREAKTVADRLVDSFQMPPLLSPWRRGLAPETYTESLNGQRVSIAAPPSLLAKMDDPGDGILALSSTDGVFMAYLFEYSLDGSLNSVLDEASVAISDGLGDTRPFDALR